MFERPHHQRIEKLLHSFNSELLEEAQCFFGGGTAIVLSLGEYRESVDIDFLCASKQGYRLLRNTVNHNGLGALLKKPVKHLREVRADLYGIRTFLEIDGVPIKFELISEGRIGICGEMHLAFGVPTLSREDMYAEKLLANTDRGSDKSVYSRDVIDLAMMMNQWGAIPEQSWAKVHDAYGKSADTAFNTAIAMISDRAYLKSCLSRMHIDEGLLDRIPVIMGCARAGVASRLVELGITLAKQGKRVDEDPGR